MKCLLLLGVCLAVASRLYGAASSPTTVFAPDQDEERALSSGPERYGLFGWLDRRSIYGQGWFPEPFRVDESDVDDELRVDWEHDEAKGGVTNTVLSEIERSFGLTTVEIEVPYLISTQALGGSRHGQVQGFGNVSLGARTPVFQYVSRDGFFDSTVGVAFELGTPTNSPISKNTELVPKVFDDFRLGNHFGVESVFGLSYLLGSKPDGGRRTFEYAFVFGYTIEPEQLRIPSVQRLIPIVELLGETGLDRANAGHNNLSATFGMRANLSPIGPLQPRFGVGYVLPVDQGAREDLSRGFILSFVFEY